MVVGAKVCDLTEDLLWFVCGLYVGILTSSLTDVSLGNTASVRLTLSRRRGQYQIFPSVREDRVWS